ncbi:hypothetical protein AWA1501_27400 [Lactiplantibacillus pentosus]|nr:hypothetical protein AWA1501_27400 [Lactiplantibacillus pentosus]
MNQNFDYKSAEFDDIIKIINTFDDFPSHFRETSIHRYPVQYMKISKKSGYCTVRTITTY